MVAVGLGSLVAQCTPSQATCDLPTGLPWYFGLAIAVVWLAVVVGAVRVGVHLVRSRREARRSRTGTGERTSTGTDVERW
jgi:hypothetical protein